MAGINFEAQKRQGIETAEACWRLSVRHGWSTRRIAAELGIAQPTVVQALKRADKRAFEHLASTVAAQKVRELKRLEMLWEAAMENYAESLRQHAAAVVKVERRKTKKRDGGEAGTVNEAELVTTDRPRRTEWSADARGWFEAARQVVADIRKLLGLDAPVKVQAIEVDRPFKDLSDEELRQQMREVMLAAGVDPATLVDPVGGVH